VKKDDKGFVVNDEIVDALSEYNLARAQFAGLDTDLYNSYVSKTYLTDPKEFANLFVRWAAQREMVMEIFEYAMAQQTAAEAETEVE